MQVLQVLLGHLISRQDADIGCKLVYETENSDWGCRKKE